MSYILNIETATEVCSVAVSDGDNILFERVETTGPSHAVLLGRFVNEAMMYLREKGRKPDAMAVSCGPGSYTGLRIGVSEAKGLCFGLDIPLIAINTLAIMAKGVIDSRLVGDDVLLCPMIDARRMEVYDVVFDNKHTTKKMVAADIIDENSFAEFLKDGKVAFFGNGAVKCKDVIKSDNAIFLDNICPLAANMVGLSQLSFDNQSFVDIAYFEPFYLKEFVATTPKNKVLSDLKK